jgi:hypothetical protein
MIFLTNKLINILQERNVMISNKRTKVDGDTLTLMAHMNSTSSAVNLPYETLCECLFLAIQNSNLKDKELEIADLMVGIKDEREPQEYYEQLKKNLGQSIVYDFQTETATRSKFYIVNLIKSWGKSEHENYPY